MVYHNISSKRKTYISHVVYSKLIVNHHTYRKKLILKGNIACVKRLSERVKVKMKIPKDKLMNLNSTVGYKIPLSFIYIHIRNVQGTENCVVFFVLNQSKQPTRSSRVEEGPKGIHCQERTEFGISRNTKVWGRRRVHSTAFICGKEPSKFMIGDNWFEGQEIKNQFQKLLRDIKNNERANNLTTIMSNRDFLVGCYLNIRSKPGNMTRSLNPETLDSINMSWFDKTVNTFKNGIFTFRPSRRTYIPKPNGKLRPLTVPSPIDKIVQDGIRILLEYIFNDIFRE